MNKIISNFVNYSGEVVNNIRNVHFDEKKDMMGNLGVFKAETQYSDNLLFTSSFKRDNGVYIYQSYYDPNKALRIYKDFANYKYTYHRDDKLVSELQSRQSNVVLTDFPTGIVTIENKVIGQEIPYYDNYLTLIENVNQGIDNKKLISSYIHILKILKELLNNGIIYSDVHAKNFMINEEGDIKLIDFESNQISFDDNKFRKESMILNLKNTITGLNSINNLSFKNDINKATNIDEIKEMVLQEEDLISPKKY